MTEHELDDDEFADIRELLAQAPMVEPREGALDQVIAAARLEIETRNAPIDLGVRRVSRRRRWAPRLAAAAVVIAIIGAVVGGVGTDTRIPAVGDLVASHQAAAAGHMPETAAEMSMRDAYKLTVNMPDSMKMEAAFVEDDETIHLLYADAEGEMVSLFWQLGETDLDRLSDGEVEMMGELPVWTAVVDENHVSVVDGVGCIWTLIADHEDAAMLTTLTDDLPTYSRSWFDRVIDTADEMLEPWRLGGLGR